MNKNEGKGWETEGWDFSLVCFSKSYQSYNKINAGKQKDSKDFNLADQQKTVVGHQICFIHLWQ